MYGLSEAGQEVLLSKSEYFKKWNSCILTRVSFFVTLRFWNASHRASSKPCVTNSPARHDFMFWNTPILKKCLLPGFWQAIRDKNASKQLFHFLKCSYWGKTRTYRLQPFPLLEFCDFDKKYMIPTLVEPSVSHRERQVDAWAPQRWWENTV